MATKSAEKMLYQRASGAFTAYRILGDSVQKDKSILLQQEDTLKALFPPPHLQENLCSGCFQSFHVTFEYIFVIFAFERTLPQNSGQIRLCPERVETSRRHLSSFFYVFFYFHKKQPKLAWNWLVELGMVLKVHPKGKR